MTPGPAIGHISGNLAGLNFCRSRSGPVVRRRLHRTYHTAARQLEQRAMIQRAYSEWRALSDLERGAWDSAARGHSWTNRLALPKQISGWQLFVRITTAQGHHHLDPITTPPRMLASAMAQNLTLTVTLPNTYTLDWAAGIGDPTYIVVAFGSRPLRTSLPAHWSYWRFLDTKTPPASTWDIQAAWTAALGAPAAGEVVAVRFRSWKQNRLPSPDQIATTTVTA